MERERGPACGRDVTTLAALPIQLRRVAGTEQHVAALYTLLGIDYAAMKAADRARAQERAREHA